MHATSDDILEHVCTREVARVFHSREALGRREALLIAGIHRAEIDVSASPDKLQRRLN
jgi:hypothetical protein